LCGKFQMFKFSKQTINGLLVCSSVFISGSCYCLNQKIQENLTKLPFHNRALELFSHHEKAVNALGSPVKIGAVRWYDLKKNYVNDHTCQWNLNVVGTKDAGVLVIRGKKVDNRWHLNLELQLEGVKEAYIIFEEPLSLDTKQEENQLKEEQHV
ncbi:hypothetical protein T09_8154, partial [Trichinella sp. T9]